MISNSDINVDFPDSSSKSTHSFSERSISLNTVEVGFPYEGNKIALSIHSRRAGAQIDFEQNKKNKLEDFQALQAQAKFFNYQR